MKLAQKADDILKIECSPLCLQHIHLLAENIPTPALEALKLSREALTLLLGSLPPVTNEISVIALDKEGFSSFYKLISAAHRNRHELSSIISEEDIVELKQALDSIFYAIQGHDVNEAAQGAIRALVDNQRDVLEELARRDTSPE